jgi:hypothetical protein
MITRREPACAPRSHPTNRPAAHPSDQPEERAASRRAVRRPCGSRRPPARNARRRVPASRRRDVAAGPGLARKGHVLILPRVPTRSDPLTRTSGPCSWARSWTAASTSTAVISAVHAAQPDLVWLPTAAGVYLSRCGSAAAPSSSQHDRAAPRGQRRYPGFLALIILWTARACCSRRERSASSPIPTSVRSRSWVRRSASVAPKSSPCCL